ncbi:hypothetical protein HL666_14470 [Bradyrhizobium sp. 83002]|uniref:hypothetical protein n=1 Tax=Bradyrhizobium aeschynomenes TaxID=2734909 RepID=UPI0015527AC0|nr:hypothetical protein [Bradyrhizobium aeschynomenes]NPU11974.1 hypothetical protein [Bradyrhizobium aeschynomenes]
MIAYIEAAGPLGIAAYEIANRGKIARDRVERIGEMFENMGIIRSAVVRLSDQGRKGTRYFLHEHVEPLISELAS